MLKKRKNKKHEIFFFHRQMKEAFNLQAYLNGERVEECAAADVKYGFVVVIARDEKKEIILDHNGEILYQIKNGIVEIKKIIN